MSFVRTTISISGFGEPEFHSGIAHLIAEFRERPWIVCPSASWDSDRERVVVRIHYEGDDLEYYSRAALDEVWDCVIACFDFASEAIHFDIDESRLSESIR